MFVFARFRAGRVVWHLFLLAETPTVDLNFPLKLLSTFTYWVIICYSLLGEFWQVLTGVIYCNADTHLAYIFRSLTCQSFSLCVITCIYFPKIRSRLIGVECLCLQWADLSRVLDPLIRDRHSSFMSYNFLSGPSFIIVLCLLVYCWKCGCPFKRFYNGVAVSPYAAASQGGGARWMYRYFVITFTKPAVLACFS